MTERRPKTIIVPGTTHFTEDADRRENRSITELQCVTTDEVGWLLV